MDKNKPELYFKIPYYLKANAIIVCIVSFIVSFICLDLDQSNRKNLTIILNIFERKILNKYYFRLPIHPSNALCYRFHS
jgi:hypothetical protein